MNSYIEKKSSANTGKQLLFQRLSEFIDNDAMHRGSLAIEKKKKNMVIYKRWQIYYVDITAP